MSSSEPSLPLESIFQGNLSVPSWLLIVIGTLVFGSYIMINQLIAPWVERKIMARMQGRRGPVHVGPFGILQIPADLLKLILKEDTRPEGADKFGFTLSIAATAITAILSFSPLPFGSDEMISANYTIGFLYVFAVFSLFPPMMLIGGWASNSKYSLIGGFRSAAQLIAYEIPMLISVLGVIAVVGSFSLVDITEYQTQHGWFIFRFLPFGLIAAFIFYLSGVAETERIPFDIPEDEASLVMGPRTEFASWRYSLLMMVEYLHLFINSLLFIYMFMGGYDLLPIPATTVPELDKLRSLWYIQFTVLTIKAYVFVAIATWLRSTLARFRIDQFLTFGWKWLLPVSLVALFAFIIGPDINIFGINWAWWW